MFSGAFVTELFLGVGKTEQPTDTLNHGTGWPAAHTGMIKSAFRGSDGKHAFERLPTFGGYDCA